MNDKVKAKTFAINVVYREWQERTMFIRIDEKDFDGPWYQSAVDRLAASEHVRKFRIYEVVQQVFMSKSFEEDYDPENLFKMMNSITPTFADDDATEKYKKAIAESTPMDFGDLRWKN